VPCTSQSHFFGRCLRLVHLQQFAHPARAAAAGVLIAISTDSHGIGELDLIRCGIDQARHAGLEKAGILKCMAWKDLQQLFRR
jgi:histidinol phosphatase-like PHP family hydrolase